MWEVLDFQRGHTYTSGLVRLFPGGISVSSTLESTIKRLCRWRVELGRMTVITVVDFTEFYMGGREQSTMASYKTVFRLVIEQARELGGGGDGRAGGQVDEGQVLGEYDEEGLYCGQHIVQGGGGYETDTGGLFLLQYCISGQGGGE